MKAVPRYLLALILFFTVLLPLPAAQEKGEKITIGMYDRLYSEVLDEERTLLICLPEGYENSKTEYPVLYVLDGDISVISEVYSVTRNLGFHSLPPMIITAVQNTNRNRDMLPDSETGGSDRFLTFFTEELGPYIEQNYRTNHFRALYGASNAGLFVLYALLQNPDAFSAYIASSPTVNWAHDLMVHKVEETVNRTDPLKQFLYIVYGDKEWAEVRDTLSTFIPRLELLGEKGLRLKTEFIPDAGHVPLNSLYKGLISLFEGYRYPDEKRRSEGLESLKTYYEQFSIRIGYKVGYPFSALNGVGQSLLFRQKKTKEAIEVFELLEQNYPGEGISDVMLAIAHYKDRNLESAKTYYLKALDNKGLEIPPFPEWEEMKELFK